jgi:hypothetical protein
MEFFVMYTKAHCWCSMYSGKVGGLVDIELADYVRAGIPLCSASCAMKYDAAAAKLDEQRERRRLAQQQAA